MTQPVELGPLDLGALADDRLAADPRLATVAAASRHPLVLLPVRLETRYRPAGASGGQGGEGQGGEGQGELLVRVYPDQVHVDAHDPRLSAAEIASGEEFWRTQWRTGSDRQRAQRAWTALAGRWGPGRAAWVVRSTAPTNPQDRPAEPVADDAPLSAEPAFPVLQALQSPEQRSTPVARLLPTRWTATAYAQGAVAAVATGRPVRPQLAVGPDLASALVHEEGSSDHDIDDGNGGDGGDGGDGDDEVAAVDEAMNWLVDFGAAEEAGMALRLPVSGPVDLLLVTGVRETGADPVADPGADPAEDAGDAAELARLLEAQRYSEGLAFLVPETLTNNAEGASSGWSSTATGSWAEVSTSPGPAPSSNRTNGSRTAHALGITATSRLDLTSLPHGDGTDDALAEAMSTALWPATWGYWLPQFAGSSLDDAEWAREHARRFVRPGGPLPTLRIGRQPYGLLPVTSLNRFTGDERENRLRQVLAALVRDAWRPVVGQAPRVGRGNVAADLVDVLRLGARSDRVQLRRAFGARFAQHAQLLLGRRLDDLGFWNVARDRALPIAAAAGLGLRPGALTVHEPDARPVTVPPVPAEDDAPAGSVLRALLAADVDRLAEHADDAPGSLLEALVRHGLLREYATAAARLIGSDTAAATAAVRDAELFGLGDPSTVGGWRQQRSAVLPDGSTVRGRLGGVLAGATDPALVRYRAAVETLAGADPAALERHLFGTLDAAAYRIDAWVTSLAARRLAELRADDAASAGEGHGEGAVGRAVAGAAVAGGAVVGGYGWAERLAPSSAPVLDEIPPGESAGLLVAADDPGFLHAPSLHQAQVAALLRNAHLANGGGRNDPFAISLTSERVRLARRIFDGVRAGRTIGEVLGYLVERDLHEVGLDKAVDNAREVCPLPGQEHLPPAARRLDGLSLHRLWADSEDHALDHLVGGELASGELGESDAKRARAVLRRLGVAVDAAADALQVEQVQQFALGDLDRAVSTVTDFDRGLVAPPGLDVVQTPRSGMVVTHRVGVVLDPEAATSAGWAEPHVSPVAAAEPALDAWLSRLLGPCEDLTVTVRDAAHDSAHDSGHGSGHGSGQGSGQGLVRTVPLPELDLSATDLVRVAGAGDAGLAELAARAADAADAELLRPVLVPDRGLLDLLELGRTLAALLGPATPMDGATLQPPHPDAVPGVDTGELEQRAAAARAAVEAVVVALDAALADTELSDALTAATVHRLRGAVVGAWAVGVGGAAVPVETTEDGWTAAAVRARDLLLTRITEADAITAGPEDPPWTAAARRLRALFGPGFVALPRFVPANAAELAASRDDPALLGGDPVAVDVWLTRMQRVREPLGRLGIALAGTEALGARSVSVGVAQVPHRPGAVWNALPAERYVDGAASLALVGAEAIRAGRAVAGLLVDEWSEQVPSATETTGVAFRYEPPELMAPHAILLAVPPVAGEPWTLGTLNQVLIETLEQAHLRAVPPGALGAVRQYLPATMLAFNSERDAVSTNPNALTGAS